MNPLIAMREWWLLLPLAAGAGALLAWASARAAKRATARWLAVLRALALAALMGLALNPGRWFSHNELGRSRRAVLLDRSISMNTEDEEGASRWHAALQALDELQPLSSKGWDLYTFSDRLEPAADAAEAARRAPDGTGTALARSGRQLLERYRAGPSLRELLIISDGRDTLRGDLSDLALRARARNCPIHVLPLGGDITPADVSIALPARRIPAFVGQPVTVRARVRAAGLGPLRAVVRVMDADGGIEASATVELGGDAETDVQVELPPLEAGYHPRILRVEPVAGEESEANNEIAFGISVLDTRIRVLMAEGVPTWDSKFLAQLLRSQPNVELTAAYRLSERRTHVVDSRAEQHETTADGVFPATREGLDAYDVLLLGQGCETFLDDERLTHLYAWLRDGGGALVFFHGKPYNGEFPALAALEPVQWRQGIQRPFRFVPRDDAHSRGLFGELLPTARDTVWQRLPRLTQAHGCHSEGAFSHVFVEGVPDEGAPFPLLASRRVGLGRVVTVNARDVWQWHFFPQQEEAAAMYEAFWSQLIHWTAVSSDFMPGSDWSLRLAASSVWPGETVPVHVRKRGATPPNDVLLEVRREGEPVRRVTAGSAGTDEGLFTALLALDEPGLYRVALSGLDDGAAHGVDALLHVRTPAGELDDRSADRRALQHLAAQSGGRQLQPGSLAEALADEDGEDAAQVLGEAFWQPAWDRWWILLPVAALFGTEWFLRRRRGML